MKKSNGSKKNVYGSVISSGLEFEQLSRKILLFSFFGGWGEPEKWISVNYLVEFKVDSESLYQLVFRQPAFLG